MQHPDAVDHLATNLQDAMNVRALRITHCSDALSLSDVVWWHRSDISLFVFNLEHDFL
jgi:hypothetical protein